MGVREPGVLQLQRRAGGEDHPGPALLQVQPLALGAVENIATGSAGVREALAEGSRVNGAGIWWWYGFYDQEAGRYPEGLAAADRAAWLSSTLTLAVHGLTAPPLPVDTVAYACRPINSGTSGGIQ